MSKYDSDRLRLLRQLTETDEVSIALPHNMRLMLRRDVFVPVQETFQLIDIAADVIDKHKNIKTIADLGTGTGVIAILLAKLYPDKTIFATDTSQMALHLAEYNARQNSIENISFIQNNAREWVSDALPGNIDFIVSNPPYIGSDEYSVPTFRESYPETYFEPEQAIKASDDIGMTAYLTILKESRRLKIGFYLFQCNADYIEALVLNIDKNVFEVDILKDDKQKERFLFLRRKQSD